MIVIPKWEYGSNAITGRVVVVMRLLGTIVISLCSIVAPTRAADDLTAEQIEFFEDQIRPVLVEHCYECHAAESKTLRGGLRVDSRDLIRAGGDSGPAIVPGNVDESLLIEAIRYESYEMPPEGVLSEAIIADFVKWVEMGAPDPRDESAAVMEDEEIDFEIAREFWSFRQPERHAIPEPADTAWSWNDIDRFILASLEAADLTPVADADRTTLIRRASFDLIGLPPSPEEVAAFLADESPQAYQRLLDRLLAAPQFGERWGRHWLDIARYADSTGGGRSLLYGEAWRYRDYVISAFNQDKPFDQFVIEQVAGDLLPYANYQQGRDQLTATGFLVLGPSNYENQDKEQLRMDVIDEQIDTVGRAFLGMTIGCARCHDHKFDPIPTTDYYALAGIFRSTRTLIDDNVSTWVKRPLPVDELTQTRLIEHDAAITTLNAEIQRRQSVLQELKSQLPMLTMDDTDAEFTGSWTSSSSVKEYVGEGYQHADGPDAQAAYRFELQHPGAYEVRVSYSAHGNRSPNALVRIEHVGGVEETRIDQTRTPPLEDLYVALGHFEFEATATVTVSTEATEGAVIADAVQLVPLFRVAATSGGQRVVADPASLPGVVVDNTQAELVGDWKESTFTKSFVGAGYIHDERTGQGAKQVVFRAELPESGQYEVRLSYNGSSSRASRVPVTVTFPGGEETVHVNQRMEPGVDGLFSSLGRFEFNNDQTAVVTISNEGVDDGYVIVDAVQFLPVSALVSAATQRDAEESASNAMQILNQITETERELSTLNSELAVLGESAPAKPPTVLSVQDADEMGDFHVCIRGSVKSPGDSVPRGFLTVAMTEEESGIAEDVSGRVELAHWIASAENPLTARVAVNRIWHHLFGTGIVRTVDNFGSPGELPSHPELLDYLALRFSDEGWSVKSMIRQIMLSRTYRLASDLHAEAEAVDPENRLLARQNRRRLDAEAIYDSLLSLSGRLDLTAGGNPVRDGTGSEYGYRFDDQRRAVYLPIFRNRLHDLFSVFDFPDPNLSTGRRNTSTLSTQALYLMNSPLVIEQSQLAAERLLAQADNDEERLELLYFRALGRSPTERERALALQFLANAGSEEDDAASGNWSSLTQAVIATIDFRYID